MIPSNNIPLYTSQKEAVIPVTKQNEKIISENVNVSIDKGNGSFILKPDISVKTEFVPSPLYVNRQKLLMRFPDKAEKILSDITNKNPLPDEVAEVLIKENIIVYDEPNNSAGSLTKNSIIKTIVNTIYNLIFS